MHASKLVQYMKTNAASMSEGLVLKIRGAERCGGLAFRVPGEEQKEYALTIYRDLLDWMATGADSTMEKRYEALGVCRANQGVPFGCLFWAVCIAREHLWDYMQQECLVEEPIEFWGGVRLLHSLNQFFDRTLYFTLLGYQKSGKDMAQVFPAQRSAA